MVQLIQWLTVEACSRDNIRRYISGLGSKPSAAERNALLEKRNQLQTKISHYESKWAGLIGNGLELEDDDVGEAISSDEDWEDDGGRDQPELRKILLPSWMKRVELLQAGLEHMESQEAELRVGQMNDALQGLRIALGEKSLLLRTDVRNNKAQKMVGRAWARVKKEDEKVQKYLRAYNRTREALSRLNPEHIMLQKFKAIRKDDLKMSGDIVEENRIGQRNDTLSWIWRIEGDMEVDDEGCPRMEECKFHIDDCGKK